MFASIKQFMETHHHFPKTTNLTKTEGSGIQIAALLKELQPKLLCSFYTLLMDTMVPIPVDSHVIKCTLKWVPPFCKSGDAV